MRRLIEVGLVTAIGIVIALAVASLVTPMLLDLWENIAQALP